MTIRTLLVDDQSMVRAGLRMLLAGEPDIDVVAEAGNGLEAVAQARRFHPHVVLMDIRMPDLDGLEATRRILAADETQRESEGSATVLMIRHEPAPASTGGHLVGDPPSKTRGDAHGFKRCPSRAVFQVSVKSARTEPQVSVEPSDLACHRTRPGLLIGTLVGDERGQRRALVGMLLFEDCPQAGGLDPPRASEEIRAPRP